MQEKFSKTSVTIRPDYRRQLKTGEFHLRLFLYQNPKLKKSYPTNIKVTPIEWTKINSEIIIPTVRHKKDLVIEILAKAKRIVKILKDDFSFEDFEEHMFGIAHRDKYDHTDVYATFQVKIDQLVAENRIGSAHVYEHVMSSFQSFRKYLKFHQVTVDFLNKYEKCMIERGLKKSTIGIRMRHLKVIVNMAKNDGVINSFDYPFGRRSHNKYEIPTSRRKKKALNLNDLLLLKNYESNDREQWARDMWLFSFYCNGMNMGDVFNLKWSNVDNDFLYFVRQKTKNMCRHEEPVEIFLTPEAKAIINHWAVHNSSLKDGFLFGIYDEDMTEEERIKINKCTLRVINKVMNKIARDLEIENRITSMVARHTWATLLMHNGVPIPYISKGLGHTSVQTTENYLADFEQGYKREIGGILSAVTSVL